MTETRVVNYEHDEFGNLLSVASAASPKTFVGGFGVHDDTTNTGLLYMPGNGITTPLWDGLLM